MFQERCSRNATFYAFLDPVDNLMTAHTDARKIDVVQENSPVKVNRRRKSSFPALCLLMRMQAALTGLRISVTASLRSLGLV